jgi:hypothetical protein
MRKFLMLIVAMWAGLLVSAWMARAAGARQETASTWLFGSRECVAPCWHGIRPGVTTMGEAEAILRTLPYVTKIVYLNAENACDLAWFIDIYPPYWGCAILERVGLHTVSAQQDRRISRFWVSVSRQYTRKGLPIRHLLIALGTPYRARLCVDGTNLASGNFYYGPHLSVGLVRFDRDGYPFPLRRLMGDWDGEGSVESLYYEPADSPALYTASTPHWLGFTPATRRAGILHRTYLSGGCG